MSDDEKEYLKLVIQSSVTSATKPLTDMLVEHSLSIQKVTQTVYGADGTNGIRGDMKIVKQDVEKLNIEKTRLMTLTTAISGGIVIAGTIFGEKIKKNSGVIMLETAQHHNQFLSGAIDLPSVITSMLKMREVQIERLEQENKELRKQLDEAQIKSQNQKQPL